MIDIEMRIVSNVKQKNTLYNIEYIKIYVLRKLQQIKRPVASAVSPKTTLSTVFIATGLTLIRAIYLGLRPVYINARTRAL